MAHDGEGEQMTEDRGQRAAVRHLSSDAFTLVVVPVAFYVLQKNRQPYM